MGRRWPAFCLSHLFCLGLFCVPALATENNSLEALPEITVRGRKPLRPVPLTPSEFSGASVDLSANTETSLPILMQEFSSLQATPNAGEGGNLGFLIRGFDAVQSRYFLEEIPLTDAEFNQGNLGLLPLETLGRIDVFAEGIPTFLGEDGLGGAIQFQLADWPLNKPPLKSTVQFGSFGYARVFAQAGFSRPQIRLSASYTQSEESFTVFDDNATPLNPSDDKFELRTNNQFKRITLLPEVNLYSDRVQKIKFFSLNTYTNLNFPGPVSVPTPGNLKSFSNLSAITHDFTNDSIAAHSSLYAKYDRNDVINAQVDPFNAASISTSSVHATDLTAGLKNHTRLSWNSVSLEGNSGLAADHYFTADGADQRGHTRFQIPVGTTAEIKFWNDALSLKPALLAHWFSYAADADEPQKKYLLASPRLGLQVRATKWLGLRAAGGSYYRAPNMHELFGAPGGLSASPNLVPEQAWKTEAGSDLSFDQPFSLSERIRFSYTISFSRATNLIAYAENSEQSFLAVNLAQSRLLMHELNLDWKSSFGISLRAGFSALDSENLTPDSLQTGKQLPNRPPYRLDGRVSFQLSKFNLSYLASWYAATYTDIPNSELRQAFTEHNAELNFESGDFGNFGIEVRNLTDVTNVAANFGPMQITDNTTGVLGYPAPGRRVYFTWKYEI